MSRVFICVALACLVAGGCSMQLSEAPGLPDVGGSSGIVTWAGNGSSRPESNQGTVYHMGKLFLVWSSSPHGGGGSTSSNIHGASCSGEITGLEGEVLKFSCATGDGKTGTATIAAQSFDLKKGGLFLVAKDTGAWRVRQLVRDLRELPINRKSLTDLAERDDEIREFFGKVRSGRQGFGEL